MVAVEVSNRSGVNVDEEEAVEFVRGVLASEGVHDGELGLAFVGPDEIRQLKREHLGINEPTDVLSFPIDGKDPVPEGVPRASATSCCARRSSGTGGASPWCTDCCTCSGMTTAPR